MRSLVMGASGQVGRALLASTPSGVQVRGVTHADADIGDARNVADLVADFRPSVIINAAGYTAVDRAESEAPEARRVNAEGPRNLATAALRHGARLLHVSTNYVFDGQASSPYLPNAPARPLNVYGTTKLAGEQAVLETLDNRALIVRTAWIYSPLGQNFVRTMMQSMNERGSVRVVADQFGSPTSAKSLAEVLWAMALRSELVGIYHWTDFGVANWYDFAVAIAEEGAARRLVRGDVVVHPVATLDYPTAARRPAYGVLDSRATSDALGISAIHWRQRLREALAGWSKGSIDA